MKTTGNGSSALIHVSDFGKARRTRSSSEFTLIRIGGHFAGYQVLHWNEGSDGSGALFSGDLPQVCMDRRWVSFMYSYPNYLPLSAASVRRIVATLEPFEFGKLFGAWPGFVVHADAKSVVRRSAERYLQALTIER